MCLLLGYLNLCVGTEYTSVGCNSCLLGYLLTSCSQYFMNCSGTTYEFVVMLSGPLVGTPEFYSSVIL